MGPQSTSQLPAGQRRVPEGQSSSGASILLDMLSEDNDKFNTRSADWGHTRVRSLDWRACARLKCRIAPEPWPPKVHRSAPQNNVSPRCPARSPVGLASGGGCLLAVATTDARVRLFRLPHGRSLRCEEVAELTQHLLAVQKMRGAPVRSMKRDVSYCIHIV